MFQGDRFGGALDAAAKQFSKAFDSGILPMEFVNKMKKDGKLIMGIGHRVKSVSDAAYSLKLRLIYMNDFPLAFNSSFPIVLTDDTDMIFSHTNLYTLTNNVNEEPVYSLYYS